MSEKEYVPQGTLAEGGAYCRAASSPCILMLLRCIVLYNEPSQALSLLLMLAVVHRKRGILILLLIPPSEALVMPIL